MSRRLIVHEVPLEPSTLREGRRDHHYPRTSFPYRVLNSAAITLQCTPILDAKPRAVLRGDRNDDIKGG